MKPKWAALVAHSPQSKDKHSRPHLEIWAEDADMTIEDARIAQHARELLRAATECGEVLDKISDTFRAIGELDQADFAAYGYRVARAAIRKARGAR